MHPLTHNCHHNPTKEKAENEQATKCLKPQNTFFLKKKPPTKANGKADQQFKLKYSDEKQGQEISFRDL